MDKNEKLIYDIIKKTNSLYVIGIDIDKYQNWKDISFSGDLGYTSLMIVELIMEIEKKLNISVSDDDILRIKTINDLMKIIKKYYE